MADTPSLPALDFNDPDTRRKALLLAGVGGLGLAAFWVMRRPAAPEAIPISQETGTLATEGAAPPSEEYLQELAGSLDKLAGDLYAYVDEQAVASQQAMETLAAQMADALGGVWGAVEEMYYGYGTEVAGAGSGYYDYEGVGVGYDSTGDKLTPTGSPMEAFIKGKDYRAAVERLKEGLLPAKTATPPEGVAGIFAAYATMKEDREGGMTKTPGGLTKTPLGRIPWVPGGFRKLAARLTPRAPLAPKAPPAPRPITPPLYGPTPYRPPSPPRTYTGGPIGYVAGRPKPPAPKTLPPKGPGGGIIRATPY